MPRNEFEIEVSGLHVRAHLEDGSYWATVVEHPGVFASGGTLDELRESVREGVALAVHGSTDEQIEMRRRDPRFLDRLRKRNEDA